MVRFKKFHSVLWLEGVEGVEQNGGGVCVCARARAHAQTNGVRGTYLQTCYMDP
jgi:hypothetical protein